MVRSATNTNAIIAYGSDKLFDIIEISIIDYNKVITYLIEDKRLRVDNENTICQNYDLTKIKDHAVRILGIVETGPSSTIHQETVHSNQTKETRNPPSRPAVLQNNLCPPR